MKTASRLMTAEDALGLPDDGMRHELIAGVLHSRPLHSARHGVVAMTISCLIGDHAEARQIGKSFAVGTGFLIARDPDTVRGADFALVRRDRLARIAGPEKHLPFAPDLAVEVAEPDESPDDIAEKTRVWLAAGSRLVWNIDPETRTATVHRPGVEPTVLAEADMLDGGEVVPGFRCRVGDLFA